MLSIAPGRGGHPINQFVLDDPESTRAVESEIPPGRMAKPEEVTAAVVWAASDEASYLTGPIRPRPANCGPGGCARRASRGHLSRRWCRTHRCLATPSNHTGFAIRSANRRHHNVSAAGASAPPAEPPPGGGGEWTRAPGYPGSARGHRAWHFIRWWRRRSGCLRPPLRPGLEPGEAEFAGGGPVRRRPGSETLIVDRASADR